MHYVVWRSARGAWKDSSPTLSYLQVLELGEVPKLDADETAHIILEFKAEGGELEIDRFADFVLQALTFQSWEIAYMLYDGRPR